MKKSLVIIKLIILIVASSGYILSLDVIQIKDGMKAQKEQIDQSIVNQQGAQFFDQLKQVKLEYLKLSQKLGLTKIFHDLINLANKECEFIKSDPIINQYVMQMKQIEQELEQLQQTPEYKAVDAAQKRIDELKETPVLTFEQGAELQKLEEQITKLSQGKFAQLTQAGDNISRKISQRIAPYNNKIKELYNKAVNLIISSPEMVALKQRILNLKNNVEYNQIITPIAGHLQAQLENLEKLREQLLSMSGEPCLEAGPNVFVSEPDLIANINREIVQAIVK